MSITMFHLHWHDGDKAAATAVAGFGTAMLALTPPGQVAIGLYAGYKLARLGWKACVWLSDYAT